MVCKVIMKLRKQFRREARIQRNREEMELFLSQACDTIHLEYLMQEWDRRNKHMG